MMTGRSAIYGVLWLFVLVRISALAAYRLACFVSGTPRPTRRGLVNTLAWLAGEPHIGPQG